VRRQELAALRGAVDGISRILKDRVDYEIASARIHKIALAAIAFTDALESRVPVTDTVRRRVACVTSRSSVFVDVAACDVAWRCLWTCRRWRCVSLALATASLSSRWTACRSLRTSLAVLRPSAS
jgi:hypothetical protein